MNVKKVSIFFLVCFVIGAALGGISQYIGLDIPIGAYIGVFIIISGAIIIKEQKKLTRSWYYQHNGNTIEVKNEVRMISLLINGQVQDSWKGLIAFTVKLKGKLPEGEEVRVVFGKSMKEICMVHVDGSLLEEA